MSLTSTDLHIIRLDDDQLALTVSRLPPRGILLIEDIDCAFPSRDEEQEMEEMLFSPTPRGRRGRRVYQRSQITLSGLLNVLDGIGSGRHQITTSQFNLTGYL
jgi:mitochondrial chaperone BCS1